jgi:hypothetical protein
MDNRKSGTWGFAKRLLCSWERSLVTVNTMLIWKDLTNDRATKMYEKRYVITLVKSNGLGCLLTVRVWRKCRRVAWRLAGSWRECCFKPTTCKTTCNISGWSNRLPTPHLLPRLGRLDMRRLHSTQAHSTASHGRVTSPTEAWLFADAQ